MDFQFNLPSDNHDLLNSSSDHYYVKHLYNENEIPEKLQGNRQLTSTHLD